MTFYVSTNGKNYFLGISLQRLSQLMRADTNFIKSTAPLRKLTRLIIETGTACGMSDSHTPHPFADASSTTTATWAAVATVMFCSKTETFSQIFIRTLGKIYLCTLLVILNSRMSILGGRDEISLETQSFPFDVSTESQSENHQV